jgi:hypothetical protein
MSFAAAWAIPLVLGLQLADEDTDASQQGILQLLHRLFLHFLFDELATLALFRPACLAALLASSVVRRCAGTPFFKR